MRSRPSLRPWQATLATSAFIALAGNVALWRELHALGLLQRPADWGLAVALALIIGAATMGLASLLAWPRVLRPVLIVLLLVTAVCSYYMLAYGVVMDPGMLTNVLQTDRKEAAALLSPWMVVALLVLAALPGWLLWRAHVAFHPWPRQIRRNTGMALLAILVAVAAFLAAFQPMAAAMRNHKQLRYQMNPLAAMWSLGAAATEPMRKMGPLAAVGRDAWLTLPAAARPPLLVLVVGETARSINFGINGYGRDTTPRLARAGVVSWLQARSCGTDTASSVPCMFSPLARSEFTGRRQEFENLLDVAQHAGMAVLWRDNQAGCKGVCARVPNETLAPGPGMNHCDANGCWDEALLDGLDERIAALDAQRRARGVLVVLHQMGSHGPAYSARSPAAFKRFVPECTTVNLQDCSAQGLRNAYDNSIAYTDHVLAATIDWLRQREDRWDTALVYVSDHGESLGENNLYLHGLPWSIAPDVQKHVPWITWLSPGFERRTGISMDCLRGLKDRPVTHDHYFHGVLGLLRIRTQALRPDLDPYGACARG